MKTKALKFSLLLVVAIVVVVGAARTSLGEQRMQHRRARRSAPYFQSHRNYHQRRHQHIAGRSRQQSNNGSGGGGGGVVPAVVKVVNVISDIGHGAQKVAKKVGKASQPLISHSAAQWRRTVDQHIMPGLNQGLSFVGEKTVEGVDVIAGHVMGTKAAEETSMAVKTLHRALISPNETSSGFFSNHDVISPHEEVSSEPKKKSYLQPPTAGYPYYSTYEAYQHSPDLIQARREYPNSIRLQQPALNRQGDQPFTVEEALYVLGKNILGKNVTDRLFPVAKTLAKGMGHIGDGLSTFGELLPAPVEFGDSALTLLPSSLVVDEDEYTRQQEEAAYEASLLATRPRQGQQTDQRLDSAPKCTTPNGGQGSCRDIQNCPILLADLGTLRKSICFKSLFVPGVCCPDQGGVNQDAALASQNPSQNQQQRPSLPPLNQPPEFIQDDLDVVVQPQGSTKRPKIKLPSLSDLPSTTPRPSPLLQGTLQTIPGSNQECGAAKIPQGRIVGGNTTFEGEHPWMVAIFLHGNNRKEFWCGGILVSKHTIVTAAHCTKDAKKRPFRPNQFTVRVGEWDLSDNDNYVEEFRVVDIQAHPDFKPNGFYNDVALFVLDQPVRFTEYIQPVCLPSGSLLTRDYTGELPVVLGWGTTYYGGEEVSKLRGVALPVWTRSDCDNSYFQPITEVFLCAGFAEGGRDACQGDSGGPLVLYEKQLQRYILLGIVSFGNRCAEPGYPGVYTRVPHFMPWILDKMI